MKPTILAIGLLISLCSASAAQRIKVSDNHRFLVRQDGKPFFYLGDTAWELFHRLNREEAELYLKNRSEKGFTVIQAVVLAELDGLNDPNPYGDRPLQENDPTRPNEAYFRHVDWIVDKAASLNLVIGMLPTWGDKWNKPAGKGGIFTLENAATYGEFLGKRYRDKPLIWILGGDRPVQNDEHLRILRALALGLRKGDAGEHLITFHPNGGASSSKWLHNEDWLDFNLMQNGHCTDTHYWERITQDYELQPVKPAMDGEPLYEDHPICFNAKERGYSNAADIRRCAYWDLFAGAHGHTYGNHSVWQMYAPNRKPINGPLNFWNDALDHPGAAQMQYVRALMESRPMLSRIPDQSLLASPPSSGLKRIQATRDQDASYAMFYIPASRSFLVNTSKISGEELKAWWYNPRTGRPAQFPPFRKEATHEFTPPDAGENIDWVLVVDDASKSYPPPGSHAL